MTSAQERQAWKLLAGIRGPWFPEEYNLRYFQLKWWLLGADRATTAFKDAAMLYGSQRLQAAANRSADRVVRRNHLVRFLAKESNRRLFATCFPTGAIFPALKEKNFYPKFKLRLNATEDLEHRVKFGQLRLELLQVGENGTRSGAFNFLVNTTVPGVFGKTRDHECAIPYASTAYLLAASNFLPSLLELSASTSSILDKLDDEIPDTDVFKAFCGGLRAIARRLKLPGDSEVEELTGIPLADLPNFPRLKRIQKPEKPKRKAKKRLVGR